ncbi:uncharacterized protein I206_100516 [Kwoniella pini CBS 10737]|uniref:Uncharacterized protein n=1 Tax=Kwoniella pini CBS 10737 TaxID=1296096 RepID=A0A1B9ID90_9TREE|nr:uncharacterized protein I206_00811 [Kwoniella pini CBS 10737]OCF53506.1 hypothetical protein I206_00811 [Kwoniella pini CBS 10737]
MLQRTQGSSTDTQSSSNGTLDQVLGSTHSKSTHEDIDGWFESQEMTLTATIPDISTLNQTELTELGSSVGTIEKLQKKMAAFPKDIRDGEEIILIDGHREAIFHSETDEECNMTIWKGVISYRSTDDEQGQSDS